MTQPLDTILAGIDAAMPDTIARWFDFLRIPSVSAQPDHREDCVAAAEWAADRLRTLGFADAAVMPTGGHPCVVAHHPAPPGAPTLLYYGHYDVQPAEPLALWTSPPFDPALSDGPHGKRAVARGAVDDKGQVMEWLEAFAAWHAAGGIPVGVTVLLEGEEEVGSVNLEPFLERHKDILCADVAVISDTNMWDIATPAITTRLRGLCYVEICLKAACRDLHSGLFGGAALNPINALTRILGELHDAEGRIQLPGFYDAVRDISPEQKAQWSSLGFDETAFLGNIGLSMPAGEANLPPLLRLWGRPTADLNGIWGGYTGVGAKTVIAAEARAKLSFRLVPDQIPETVLAQLRDFVAARLPDDATVEYQVFGLASGIAVPTDSTAVAAARAALADEFGRPAVLIGSGGSIPVVDSLKRVLGIDSLLMGFGLDDDQIHSPNEKFEVECLRRGIRSHARLLGKFVDIQEGLLF